MQPNLPYYRMAIILKRRLIAKTCQTVYLIFNSGTAIFRVSQSHQSCPPQRRQSRTKRPTYFCPTINTNFPLWWYHQKNEAPICANCLAALWIRPMCNVDMAISPQKRASHVESLENMISMMSKSIGDYSSLEKLSVEAQKFGNRRRAIQWMKEVSFIKSHHIACISRVQHFFFLHAYPVNLNTSRLKYSWLSSPFYRKHLLS